MRAAVFTLTWMFASTAAAETPPAQIWDPIHVGSIDAWKAPFAKYEFVHEGPVASGNWRYEFAADEFTKLKKLSASQCAPKDPCPRKVVVTIATPEKRDEIRKLLIKSESTMMKFVVGTLASLHPQGWGYELMELAIGSTKPAKDLKVQQDSLANLLAVGGEIVYEERLSNKGAWFLTRSIYYRVKVGDELRQVPLWVSRMAAEIK